MGPLESIGEWISENRNAIVATTAGLVVGTGVTIALLATAPVSMPALLAVGGAVAAGAFIGTAFTYVALSAFDGADLQDRSIVLRATAHATVAAGLSFLTVGALGPAGGVATGPAGVALGESSLATIAAQAPTRFVVGAGAAGAQQLASNLIEGRPSEEGMPTALLLGGTLTTVATTAGDLHQGVFAPDPIADARPVLRHSSSLEQDLAYYRAQGWRIRYGEPGRGTFMTDPAPGVPGEIVIDPLRRPSPTSLTNGLAHEVGHANAGAPPTYGPSATIATREEFARINVLQQLDGEGIAVLNEATVRSEILAAGGPDIGGSPAIPRYADILNDPSIGAWEQARRLGNNYRYETPSTNPAVNYGRYWSAYYEDWWDRVMGSGPLTVTKGTATTAPATSPGILGAIGR